MGFLAAIPPAIAAGSTATAATAAGTAAAAGATTAAGAAAGATALGATTLEGLTITAPAAAGGGGAAAAAAAGATAAGAGVAAAQSSKSKTFLEALKSPAGKTALGSVAGGLAPLAFQPKMPTPPPPPTPPVIGQGFLSGPTGLAGLNRTTMLGGTMGGVLGRPSVSRRSVLGG